MILYGLYGFTHGWATVLTVMSPSGATAARRHLEAGDGVIAKAGESRLTQYRARRDGALEGLIEAHGIRVLSKPEWDAKKAELGEAIWR